MADEFDCWLQVGGGAGASAAASRDVPLFLQDEVAPGAAAAAVLHRAVASNINGSNAARAGPPAFLTDVQATVTTAAVATAPAVFSSAEHLHFTWALNVHAPAGKGASRLVDYQLSREKILGKGNFGCATLYRNETRLHLVRNPQVVVKDVNLQAMSSEREREVRALVGEVSVLEIVRGHPNCLRLFGFFSSAAMGTEAEKRCEKKPGRRADNSVRAFEQALLDRDTKMAFILTEFCGGGDLASKIEAQQNAHHNTRNSSSDGGYSSYNGTNKLNARYFSESFMASVLIQLLVGLDYLHSTKKVIHRDLKPQNLFFREDGVSLRLGDFGIAFSETTRNPYSNSKSNDHTTTGSSSSANKEVKGTPFYMAPELFEERSRYSFPVDVWSAGVLLYECVALEKPFLSSSYAGLSQLVLAGRCTPLLEREELRNPSYDERGGAIQGGVSVDEFIFSKPLIDIVTSMLAVDVALRPSAHRLLKKRYVREHLHCVPAALLRTEAYQRVFGTDVVAAVLTQQMPFPGLSEVEEEDGAPVIVDTEHDNGVGGGGGGGSPPPPQEAEENFSDDFDEFEDDFESSGGD